MRFLKTLLGLAPLALCASAFAIPLTYTESFTASGTLNGATFSQQLVTITFSGDSSNVSFVPGPNAYTLNTSAVFGTVGNGTPFEFNDSFQLVDHGTQFSFTDKTSNVGFLGTTASAFSGYNLGSPISVSAGATTFQPSGFLTSDGTFGIISTGNSTVTVTGAAVAATPEPSGLLLLGTGVLSVAGAVRRRFRR